ncbi:hypothetical protein LTR85_008286 [Meristemomyces frigidus]|nr:hypothetical protein LTR85_008286 [Meristemomyces frigidus]
MCCHRLFIYTTCGHSTFSPKPLILCRHASIPPDGSHSTRCELIAHPYQSWKFEKLCPPCQNRRDSMLGRIERTTRVDYDEWKWKVSYALPLHGKDYWTTKMEKLEAAEREKETASVVSRRKSIKRFSWKRKSKVKSMRETE